MATVSKNIFWSLLTSLLQLYTGSAVFVVLAKLMSIEDFGILSFGFSLSALAIIVADYGFSLMVIKDYPEQGASPQKYISNSLLAKVFLAVISAILFLIYLIVFYEGQWRVIGALYIVFAMLAAFVIYLQAVLKAQNRFHKFTESSIVYAVAITVSILVYWLLQLSLFQLVLCLLLSKGAQLLWTLILCRSSISTSSFDKKLISKLIKNSWSFGLHTILGIFYFMIDTQIISLYLGAKEVALYQSVFRIVMILMVVSDIFSNVLLPYLSFKYFQKEDLTELVSKIFLYLLLIGCSVFLFFTSFKTELLTVLYTSEYLSAVILVLPLSIVIILRTISSLLGNILTVSNKQEYRVLTVAISLAVSIVLNLILIPKYGILAAAWVSVLVHIILFMLYFRYSRREVASIQLMKPTNIVILAMTVLTYITVDYFDNQTLLIPLGCAVVWLVFSAFVLSRDNNFTFLKQLLKQKGVG